MLSHPGPREIQPAILYVFIELVVVLATKDKLIGGSVHTHKRVERRSLQSGDLPHQVPVESIVYIFILLLFYQTALQGQHLAVLLTAEQHVKADTATARKIVRLIFKDFSILLPVLQ